MIRSPFLLISALLELIKLSYIRITVSIPERPPSIDTVVSVCLELYKKKNNYVLHRPA